ncbi:MAG TPA: AMP-binding protein [Acidimicrobiia bacterium]|nr:AMP-binding protein [Acidimicrobiia bacterium]
MSAAPAPEGVSYGRRITDLAAAHPDTTAIVFAPEGADDREITWRELDARSTQVARLLADRGAGPGTWVAVGIVNSPEHFYATIGAWKAGAGVLPIRADLPAWERERLLAVAGVVLLVGDHAGSAVPVVTLDEVLATTGLDTSPLPDVIADPAAAIASSGSTGRPKVIVAPFPGVHVEGLNKPMPSVYVELPERLPQLIPAPLYHTNGFWIAHNTLRTDDYVVVMEHFDAERAFQLVERWRIACFSAVPTMLARMARVEDRAQYDLSSLQYVMQGGATVPDWVVEAWIDLIGADRFYMSYGSTERVGLTIIRADDWLGHRGSVGRGFETDIRILDADGNDLPPGEIGEIYMRRPLDPVTPFAYVGADPPPTTPDGYTSIGDLGRLDEDGYLYVADRRTDMIVTGGANVFPAEVEAALSEHPKVRDVVVIGLPDPEWGHRVHAIVEPTDPADRPSAHELDAFARSRIAAYKVPKGYEIVERIPRTEAGKINRTALAEERAPAP